VVEPVCDDEGGKKRNGYHYTASRFLSELDEPAAVGLEAARKTVAKLGPRKLSTRDAAVVFDPDAGRAILRLIFSCANGTSFYKKSSYLIGREGSEIASKLVTVTDDPLIARGPGSRPFDGDGLPARKNLIVEAGILRTVLCDVYSGRKLGRPSTGSAGRGIGGTPGVTTSNFVMARGQTGKDDVVRQTASGLYVTDMMGFGFNPVTGDFSRGASGFWIENGQKTYPVSEITISANLDEILKGIDLVGDDLDMRTSTACPTFRVARMTIAGT
jgi:PmbA protein